MFRPKVELSAAKNSQLEVASDLASGNELTSSGLEQHPVSHQLARRPLRD